ncbi:MAG: DnaJ domain heat shock protein [Elusimicrobia bacterium]|nr:MAG: DnaJ domain heat shock protein [Elusimicrobiota bacterium]KAF0158386.1 MAG: DnaJ domain heat shock protein [Elusimicrobiota bacterium]
MKTWFYILSALYLLSPIDLLPERALGRLGFIDDIVVIAALYWYMIRRPARLKAGQVKGEEKVGLNEKAGPGEKDNDKPEDIKGEQDPYKVLGVTKSASAEEIRQAYLKLANKYHPDKVDHLGDEFKAMAHRRFKEIQAAYERLSPKSK